MKMPRFIQADKANHRVRGSEVAGVSATLAMVLTIAAVRLLGLPMTTWAFFAIAAVAAVLGARAAGMFVEHRQARINAQAAARGEPPPHAIEEADIAATAWSAWPVVLPLALVVVLAA